MEALVLMILQTDHKICLPCFVNDIRDFTINNCDFYFLDKSGCHLVKWSQTTGDTHTVVLQKKYLCICFDYKENCYWAIPECKPYLIDKLDICFHKIDHITVKGCQNMQPLSLCCADIGNRLLISYSYSSAFVDKCTCEITFDKNTDTKNINLGSIFCCNCMVNCSYQGSRQILEIVSSGCPKESIEICIPKIYNMIAINPYKCNSLCSECKFCVLLVDICSHEFIMMEYLVDFSDAKCKPQCPPEHNHSGIYEIMHSIALEEAGISHILNAEGEKIQKAVAISDNIEDLICVNESVKRTVTQITLLEGMLYSKLEAVLSYDNSCNNPKPCPPKPCPPKPCPTKPCPPKPCNKSGGDKK